MTSQLSQYIGKEYPARLIPELLVKVTIKDAKLSYGRIRYLVTPVSGEGEVWIEGFKMDLPSTNLELNDKGV